MKPIIVAGTLALTFAAGCVPPETVPPDPQETVDSGVPVDPASFAWKVEQVPPGRSTHRAFFWAPLNATLMLSGNHQTGPINDLWSWDGKAWAQLPLNAADFPSRKNAAAAVDTAHQRLYVFGGVQSGYDATGAYVVTYLADFLSWDGAAWRVETATGPSARAGSMVFDEERKQLVLFGGAGPTAALDDTWLFDGTAWSQVAQGPAMRPPPRLNPQLAWDGARRKVVLFGGQEYGATGIAKNLQDTWEWDGQAWAEVVVASPPPARGMGAMAYDASRQRVVLMGGATVFPPVTPPDTLADVWEYDGATWAPLATSGPAPTARTAASLSFDPVRQRLVLYGGYDGITDLTDLWELHGQAWESHVLLPLPRSGGAFAQRGPGQEAVLMGGYITAGGSYLNDTWRYTSGQWTQVFGKAPSARSEACMAFHEGAALLVGGAGLNHQLSGDNFVLAAGSNDWVRVVGPPGRIQCAAAFDPVRHLTVVFGGRVNSPLDDTWVYDGTSWKKLSPPTSPPGRSNAWMLFDPVLQQVVLLGGKSTTKLNDAWAFDGTTWQALEGVTAAPTPRMWVTQMFDSTGRRWSFGGYDGNNAVLGDTAYFENGAWTTLPAAGPSPRFRGLLLDQGANRFQVVMGTATDFRSNWVDYPEVWSFGPPDAPQPAGG